jgi:hypothetical protein
VSAIRILVLLVLVWIAFGILSILLHAVKWLLILALLISLAVVISGAITNRTR